MSKSERDIEKLLKNPHYVMNDEEVKQLEEYKRNQAEKQEAVHKNVFMKHNPDVPVTEDTEE